MGDEDRAFDEGFGGDEAEMAPLEGEQKGGFLGGALLKILKFAAMGIGAIIFIVTVVIITMRIINRGNQPQGGYEATSEAMQDTPPELTWYDNIPEIRTRTSDENAVTVIVKVNLGYEIEDKKTQTELISRTPRLQDMIRGFFAEKTASQLTPAHEEELKEELKQKINNVLSDGRIREVIFLDFNIMEF